MPRNARPPKRRDMRPHMRGPVLVDFESRSRANLKKKGGRLYWQDPSSEAICAVLYDTYEDRWSTWAPGAPLPAIDVAVAHNASTFDRHAAAACGWDVSGWRDSASAARRAGLPGKLDALGQRWLGRKKDKAGNKFTVALSRASRAKARFGQLPELTAEVVQRVLEYCRDDVEIMAESWDRLEPWLDVEPEVYAVDQTINERGVCLDKDLVHALQRQIDRQKDQAVKRGAKALGQSPELTRKQASSPQQFCAETGLPNAQKATIEDAIAAPEMWEDGEVHPLVAVRKALASVVPGKLAAALSMVSDDGRLRDMFLYCGAHTWRWSGRGLQPHNLNRISFEDEAKRIGWQVDDYIEALCDGAMRSDPAELSKKQVSGLLRSVLVASPGRRLGVLDYSGIEARGNAWAAGDEDALEVFRALDAGHGKDPYCIMASEIFGREISKADKDERGIGKIAELACGYGMGGPKFGDTCAKAKADLAALGISADDAVSAWRAKHSPIVRMWKDCEVAFRRAAQGEGGERGLRAGRWRYVSKPAADGRGGIDVWCVLPSGRPIVYANARAKLVNRKSRRGSTFKAWELSYQGRNPWREHAYGGLLVENAIQALCRDLLADALVRFEAAGLDPVAHVHDEGVCEIDDDVAEEGLDEMRHIMSTPPTWADGLPIHLDGFVARRYRK